MHVIFIYLLGGDLDHVLVWGELGGAGSIMHQFGRPRPPLHQNRNAKPSLHHGLRPQRHPRTNQHYHDLQSGKQFDCNGRSSTVHHWQQDTSLLSTVVAEEYITQQQRAA